LKHFSLTSAAGDANTWSYCLRMAAAALAKIFGTGKKGEPPSPQQAIQKLRETEDMLSKKSEFLEKKIEKEMQAVRKNGMKNKRGEGGRAV